MSNNSKQWSSANPGYIIFLIDQSGSMAEDYTCLISKQADVYFIQNHAKTVS